MRQEFYFERVMHYTLTGRLIGFFMSLFLTFSTFFLLLYPILSGNMTRIAIYIFAVLQALIQSIFFLNILGEKGPKWNLFVYATTISIVITIIVATIWVMRHLNYNMMPAM